MLPTKESDSPASSVNTPTLSWNMPWLGQTTNRTSRQPTAMSAARRPGSLACLRSSQDGLELASKSAVEGLLNVEPSLDRVDIRTCQLGSADELNRAVAKGESCCRRPTQAVEAGSKETDSALVQDCTVQSGLKEVMDEVIAASSSTWASIRRCAGPEVPAREGAGACVSWSPPAQSANTKGQRHLRRRF